MPVSPADSFERLHLVLRRASAVGVGCQYWSAVEYGVPAAQLKELGLARLIGANVPTCEDHGCHLIDTCRHRVVFAEKRPGIANRKFRLTPEGVGAAESTAALAARLADVPLARRILDVLAEAGEGETLSGFDLYWRLLPPELDDLIESGQATGRRVSRPAVRFYLDLLIATGWLREDPLEGTIQRT